jgi:hypothetical protein
VHAAAPGQQLYRFKSLSLAEFQADINGEILADRFSIAMGAAGDEDDDVSSSSSARDSSPNSLATMAVAKRFVGNLVAKRDSTLTSAGSGAGGGTDGASTDGGGDAAAAVPEPAPGGAAQE